MNSFIKRIVFVLILTVFASVSGLAQTAYNGITAHRGSSIDVPENTLEAFQRAIDIGADWVETDVYKTADNCLVLIHDGNTQRTTGKNLEVEKSTYAELVQLDYATVFRNKKEKTLKEVPFGKIPLLEEALELIIKNGRARLSLQPKNNCVDECIVLVKKMKAEKWVGFNDGSLTKMSRVKELAPSIPVFWDLGANPDLPKSIEIAKSKGFESLVLHYSGMTVEKATTIKKSGLIPGIWTLNDSKQSIEFWKMGVERFYTDDPELFLKTKKEAGIK